VINLLDNAIRHSPMTLITVEARREMRQVILSVTDQGPGIEPSQRQAVFERLLDLTRRSRGPGSHDRQELVEAHGQEIWYEDARTTARDSSSPPGG